MRRFTQLLVAAGLFTFVLGGCDQGNSSHAGHDHSANAEHVDEGSSGHDNEHGPDDGQNHETHDGEDQ